MRILIAQLNYKLGDFSGNFAKISETIQRYAHHADLLVFSELCLSGYYPKDLINSEGFLETQNFYLEKIQTLTKEFNIAVVLGIVTKNLQKGKPFHNSLCLIDCGNNTYTYHKRILPVYNIFDETRHFSPGKEIGIFSFHDQKIGFLICEDGWVASDPSLYPEDPVEDFIDAKLDLIIGINGSPSNVGKEEQRIETFAAIAKKCHVPLAFVNQIGGNDDIVFDGASFILSAKGEPLGKLPSFQEAIGIFTCKQKNIHLSSGFFPYDFLSSIALFYEQAILGLKDYVRKCGFKTVVIGISGGVDSAITLALATKALGSDNIVGLAMPSRYSSTHSLTDAQLLCDTFKVKLIVHSIEPEFTLALARFEETYGEKPLPITSQNIQARLRGRILMEYSNQTGALVLSTGNKSELSVGYTTLYGDMTGGFNLIGDLYKTDVYQLCDYFNQVNPSTPIPKSIIEKIPSAELAPNQKDSDTLPEYALLDPILKLYIEGDLLPQKEIQTYQKLLNHTPKSLIHKVHHMVNMAEFKRRQAAPIVRVQRRAFGHGRQFPIAANFSFTQNDHPKD